MNHEQEAKSVQLAIYKRLTYAEKYKQLLELRAFAWSLKKTAVKADHSSCASLVMQVCSCTIKTLLKKILCHGEAVGFYVYSRLAY